LISPELSVNSPGNPRSLEEKKEGFRGKEGFKPGMKKWGVIDDESSESMEQAEEAPVKDWMSQNWRD